MSQSSHIAYFGYGSLVNPDTLSGNVICYAPARLKGWRRQWQTRQIGEGEDSSLADVALLSVFEEPSTTIDGIVIIDSVESLPALDEREHHYDRVRLDPAALTLTGEFKAVEGKQKPSDQMLKGLLETAFIYRGNTLGDGVKDRDQLPKLLQSYLDVVLAGFSRMHGKGEMGDRELGEGALERFVASTSGFEREMIADRDQPIYRRAIAVDGETAARHDALLRKAGVSW